jgi:hypothetical protein
MSSTSEPLSPGTDRMLGDMRGERWECRELEDRGGSKFPRGCDLDCESVDGCLCGLR